MTKINLLLNDYFNRKPHIRKAYAEGLINRRALARHIIKEEALNDSLDAMITALRRFDVPEAEKESLDIVKKINISTKGSIAIICMEKNNDTLEKLNKVISIVDYSKNETLKIVEGNQSLKLFVDGSKVGKIKEIFSSKDIIKIIKNIAELNLIFPENAIKTKGIVAYITANLQMNDINIVEILSCTPELIIYIDEKDLIKTYETVKRLQ